MSSCQLPRVLRLCALISPTNRSQACRTFSLAKPISLPTNVRHAHTRTSLHPHRHNPGTFAPTTAERAINLHFQQITRAPFGRIRHESKLSQVSHPGCASGQLPSLHPPICYRNMDEAYAFSLMAPDSSHPRSQPQSMAGCPIALRLTAGGSALPGESSRNVNHGGQ
jgi:ribosomal protein S10